MNGGESYWAEDVVSGNFSNDAVFCDCCGGGDFLDFEHLTSEEHTIRSEVRPSSSEVAQLFLARVIVRLAAVREGREQQQQRKALARSWKSP